MSDNSIPQEDIEKNRQLAALSYLWIFSLILLAARRESPFIQLHARQGTVLFILSILLWPLAFTRVLELLILALMVLGFIQAALGVPYVMPVIGDLAAGKLSAENLRRAWHSFRHNAIRLFKPEHVIPYFPEKAEKTPPAAPAGETGFDPRRLRNDAEDGKLSALLHRVEEDEKKIEKLEEAVDNLKH